MLEGDDENGVELCEKGLPDREVSLGQGCNMWEDVPGVYVLVGGRIVVEELTEDGEGATRLAGLLLNRREEEIVFGEEPIFF